MMRLIIGLAIAGATLNGVAAGVETSLEAVTNVVCEWQGEELRDWRWHDYAAEFAASPRQRIFFELESRSAGYGYVRLDSRVSKYFDATAPGHSRVYEVNPSLLTGKTNLTFRLNPPMRTNDQGWLGEHSLKRLEIAEVRLKTPISANSAQGGVIFRLKTAKPGRGRFRWARADMGGLRSHHFEIVPDGEEHAYYLPLDSKSDWWGEIVYADFVDCDEHPIAVSDFRTLSAKVSIAPTLAIMSARFADAFNREDTENAVEVVVLNQGTRPLTGLRVELVSAPPEARVVRRSSYSTTVEPNDVSMVALSLAGLPVGEHELKLEVSGDGVAPKPVSVMAKVTPSLGLAKANYPPEPKPVESDYEIGAFYFPGWYDGFREGTAWKAVWHTDHQRKPALGWYDETDPEQVDWQIKYLAENGIKFLLVDMNLSKGEGPKLEHFIESIHRSKYRQYIKWAVHWCNHDNHVPKVEDMRELATYWCTNYFNRSEYYRIDDRPVVMVYEPGTLDRNLGAGGCSNALAVARATAREHGYKDIYFIGMKWNERDTDLATLRKCAEQGFDATSIYHFMDHDGTAADIKVFPYSLTLRASARHWESWRENSRKVGLEFLPNISTGWDDRPWTEIRRITDKNAGEFREICRQAKAFADRHGLKRLVLGPINEWGEGSYCEPNAEFGFGFYEAIRETFCREPTGGWPLNYAPKDVGLGPYDGFGKRR